VAFVSRFSLGVIVQRRQRALAASILSSVAVEILSREKQILGVTKSEN
jgi:hypothetical protein